MFLKTILSFVLILCLISFLESLEVKTTSGIIIGKTIDVSNKTIDQFLNIPYAEPPIGKLRFSKPVPMKEALKSKIDGTKSSNRECMQFDHRASHLIQTEDCLLLNVWSPSSHNISDLKPVMFFIHGGGLHSGSAIGVDGSVLATYDVVIVTINYRLGPFGFLYGGSESAPGNVGFFDQNMALKWVKQNIHSFGGNPNEITIFGESAGSWSVSAQVLSPESKGLFKRAILESGSVMNNKNIGNVPKVKALNQAKEYAKHFKCSDNQWLDCLRKVDAKELNGYHNISNYAVYETEFLPSNAEKAFITHNFNSDIDLMGGVMRNEGSTLAQSYPKCNNLKSAEEFKHLVESLPFPELNSEKITEFYLKNIDKNSSEALKWAFYDLYGDIYITCPTFHFAKQFSESSPKQNVFFFEWTYPVSTNYGVSHGSELRFVFGDPVIKNDHDKKFSEDAMKMWTNFAKYGKPLQGFPSSLEWPRFTQPGDSKNITKAKEFNPSKPNHIIENLFGNTCDGFWKSYYV